MCFGQSGSMRLSSKYNLLKQFTLIEFSVCDLALTLLFKSSDSINVPT